MQGTMLVYRPEAFQPAEIALAKPLSLDALSFALGGLPRLLLPFNWIEPSVRVGARDCRTFVRAITDDMAENPGASTHFQRALRRRGRLDKPTLYGPVAVVFGDAEFMGAIERLAQTLRATAA